MPLNPHTFPLVPLTAPAPELDIRSGMGAHDPYALEAPTDRLLPFVLTRRTSRRNAPWLSCAWLIDARTGQKLIVLMPTGAQPGPAPVPNLGLVVQKLPDPLNEAEHFTYEAALIPGLVDMIPCGVPLRLIVDNAYQSPLFYAVDTTANLRASHLRLEWYHDGPLQGVPYGRGLRQTFYLNNGSLQFLDHRVVQETTKDPNGGPDRVDSLTVFAQRQFVIDPVPAYLSDAIEAAQGVDNFLADGRPWRVVSTKATPSGADGGRWSITGVLEDLTPLLSRGCATPALATTAYDPAYVPRGWRCGDTSDVLPDYQPTGAFSCELDSNQQNTGYVLEETEDLNPNSANYGQVSSQRSTSPDLARCPLAPPPGMFSSAELRRSVAKNDCASGYTGTVVEYVVLAGAYTSTARQQAADDQAIADADANAQGYANANGSCVYGRRVALVNVRSALRQTAFDLERTDSLGDVLVRVAVSGQFDNGANGGVGPGSYQEDFTILNGDMALRQESIAYGGATLVGPATVRIVATTPANYTF